MSLVEFLKHIFCSLDSGEGFCLSKYWSVSGILKSGWKMFICEDFIQFDCGWVCGVWFPNQGEDMVLREVDAALKSQLDLYASMLRWSEPKPWYPLLPVTEPGCENWSIWSTMFQPWSWAQRSCLLPWGEHQVPSLLSWGWMSIWFSRVIPGSGWIPSEGCETMAALTKIWSHRNMETLSWKLLKMLFIVTSPFLCYSSCIQIWNINSKHQNIIQGSVCTAAGRRRMAAGQRTSTWNHEWCRNAQQTELMGTKRVKEEMLDQMCLQLRAFSFLYTPI